jgi:hypothetical protein
MSRTAPLGVAPQHHPLEAAIGRANEPCPSITQSPCHRIPGPSAGRKDPPAAADWAA